LSRKVRSRSLRPTRGMCRPLAVSPRRNVRASVAAVKSPTSVDPTGWPAGQPRERLSSHGVTSGDCCRRHRCGPTWEYGSSRADVSVTPTASDVHRLAGPHCCLGSPTTCSLADTVSNVSNCPVLPRHDPVGRTADDIQNAARWRPPSTAVQVPLMYPACSEHR
jgi:hypothetical protein